MFILLDGEVEVSKSLLLKVAGRGMDQRDKSLIRLTGDDYAFFGEMALFDSNAERSASVTAKSKCVIAEIAQEDFFKLTESDHEIGYHVLKNIVTIISNRLDKTTQGRAQAYNGPEPGVGEVIVPLLHAHVPSPAVAVTHQFHYYKDQNAGTSEILHPARRRR